MNGTQRADEPKRSTPGRATGRADSTQADSDQDASDSDQTPRMPTRVRDADQIGDLTRSPPSATRPMPRAISWRPRPRPGTLGHDAHRAPGPQSSNPTKARACGARRQRSIASRRTSAGRGPRAPAPSAPPSVTRPPRRATRRRGGGMLAQAIDRAIAASDASPAEKIERVRARAQADRARAAADRERAARISRGRS